MARRETETAKVPSRPYAALQGLGRATQILEAVAEHPMRAAEIADRLGLKWTTAHRSLTYLQDHRYLRRDEDSGTYRIGPRLYFLGQGYLQNHPLIDAGASELRVLAMQTGASTQLNEREGLVVTVLMSVDPAAEAIPKTSEAYRFPLHTGSKGQVLLAYSDPSVYDELVAEPLIPLTQKSIVDAIQLVEVLAEIRSQGYAITRGDVQATTGSVAAPIFRAAGELVGAVCGIVRIVELDDEQFERTLIESVVSMAREVSLRLGWRHGDVPSCMARWATR